MKKRILSLVTTLALTLALLPATVVPAGAVTVSSSEQFHAALANAKDGDTIQVNGSFVVKNPVSNNDSLVINKKVTIQGGSLTLWYCGILLGADVTFKDITLGLAPNERNAIMANGHTLTLENVQRDPSARYIHLFCGGLSGGEQANTPQGSHGKIFLKGNTNLGQANIYAGSISTDGNSNEFDKPATVTVDTSFKGTSIEHIYASGALQTPTSPDDWFDYKNEIAPPTPSAERFPVSGEVTFNLYGTAVKSVDGEAKPGNYATVTYNDNSGYLNYNLVLTNIGGLKVQTGNLTPALGSSLANGATLTVPSGGILGLQNLDSPVSIGDFTGGGSLVLGEGQQLEVTKTVMGITTVGIGGIFNGHSQAVLTVGEAYITAPNSAADSFTLAAPVSGPDMTLTKSENGEWKVEGGHLAPAPIVHDFAITSVLFDPNEPDNVSFYTALPLEYLTYEPNSADNPIEYIPLTIWVNEKKATRNDDKGTYNYTIDDSELGKLELAVVGSLDGGEVQISTVTDDDQVVPLTGPYTIEVTVPAENSGTGQSITRTATLTVKAESGDTPIPVPVTNKDLTYNNEEQVGVPLNEAYVLSDGSTVSATDAGSYTAQVMPAYGFTWEGGGMETKEIFWSIAKAAGPAAPMGLITTAPSTYNGTDGTITGTAAKMQYANNADFTGATQCTDGETTGLVPGDYYVRIAESTNYKAGAATLVTVPYGPITVHSVKISDGASYKTAYKVGDTLDVTGLTLAVTMTNNQTYTVPVAVGMVSGFDSATATDSQTLTITYGDKTVTYGITVAEADSTDPSDPTDPADPVAVTGVSLNKSTTSLTVGSSEQLTATVSPDNASNKNVTWSSNHAAVAAVDTNGKVTAASAGTAVITVTTEDGSKTASCTVTVNSTGGSGSTGGGGSSGGSGSTGGGSTGDSGSTGDGGFTGGGSTDGGDSTVDSSSTSNTTSNTTTNDDGSVSTTVTDKSTGTVTTTTKYTDGSTTVVETKKNGTVTITDTAKNGVKVEAVFKPESDTTAQVTIPKSVKTVAVTVPVAVTPGMVAVDAKSGKIVKLSVPTEDGMTVKLNGSAELILVDRSKPFTDIDGHWAKDEIDFATAHAMFDGTSNTTFSPNDTMTRAMIAVVLHNFEDNPKSTTQHSFTDVDPDAWYANGINWMIDKGITGGYGNGSFGANDSVTREQLVTFLYRYAKSKGYKTTTSAGLSGFADGNSVSGYATEAMRWAVGNGLIVGGNGGTLDPQGSATRAQIAAILKRFTVNLTLAAR